LAIKKPLYKLIKFNLEEIQIQVITVIQIFKSKKPLQILDRLINQFSFNHFCFNSINIRSNLLFVEMMELKINDNFE
jgi:hypothetical protein